MGMMALSPNGGAPLSRAAGPNTTPVVLESPNSAIRHDHRARRGSPVPAARVVVRVIIAHTPGRDHVQGLGPVGAVHVPPGGGPTGIGANTDSRFVRLRAIFLLETNFSGPLQVTWRFTPQLVLDQDSLLDWQVRMISFGLLTCPPMTKSAPSSETSVFEAGTVRPKSLQKMLFSVGFFSRPFDYFLSADDHGGFRHERTVFHDDAQWSGPEPALGATIRLASDLHQVLYVIQDAASLWYPGCVAAVFRVIHGDAVQNVPTTAPTQLLTAMCNLYQAVFYEVYDDIRHGLDLQELST
ncbi:hypothetical protein DVH05_026811 [Phytophthora capsici]|nr:hypothetical protein DVH05_026811 [Phytophthora capsici]